MEIINDKNELQTFFYQEKNVRTIIKDGEPWFVAKDICDVFNETNRNRAMRILDDDERGYTQMITPGGMQEVAIINESGLYSLLFAMQPSKARGVSKKYIVEKQQKLNKFKRWVTHDVLPSIRAHGAYFTASTAEKLLNDPDVLITMLNTIKEERSEKERLQAKVESDKPKIVFADAVSVSQGAISVADLAKILKGNGIEIGQKRLFQRLREDGFLIRREGSDRNSPTQRAMQLGLFRIKETAITRSDGRITISKTAKVTGRGQCYFIDYFLNKREFSYAD